ncbi:hypothetical protein Tco_0939029, partial [Tanacetum coccineum]
DFPDCEDSRACSIPQEFHILSFILGIQDDEFIRQDIRGLFYGRFSFYDPSVDKIKEVKHVARDEAVTIHFIYIAINFPITVQSKEEYDTHVKMIVESLKEEKMYVKFSNNVEAEQRKLSRCGRNQMGNEPILALPGGANDFVVYYDARSKDLEACLEKEKVIACTSRQLKVLMKDCITNVMLPWSRKKE